MSEHKAGRELDALVAERVMGVPWVHCYFGRGFLERFLSTDSRYEVADGSEPIAERLHDVPYYSTSLQAAWAVVERMEELGWDLILYRCSDGVRATFRRYDRPVEYGSAADPRVTGRTNSLSASPRWRPCGARRRAHETAHPRAGRGAACPAPHHQAAEAAV